MQDPIITVQDIDILLILLRIEQERKKVLFVSDVGIEYEMSEVLPIYGLEGRLLRLRYFLTE